MTDDAKLPARLIGPIGPRVLVRILPKDQRTRAGLFLPPGTGEEGKDALYGEVVEVARAGAGATASDATNVSGIPAAARVLVAPDAGFRVPWDPALRVVESKDVLAVVEELDPDRTH